MKRVALVLLVAALALAEQQRCVTVCEKTQDRGMVCEVKCADLIHYDLFPSSCEEDCTYACMMTDLYNDQCYWGCGCPKDAKIGSAIACIDKHHSLATPGAVLPIELRPARHPSAEHVE